MRIPGFVRKLGTRAAHIRDVMGDVHGNYQKTMNAVEGVVRPVEMLGVTGATGYGAYRAYKGAKNKIKARQEAKKNPIKRLVRRVRG